MTTGGYVPFRSKGTFNAYRREVEKLLQWTWQIKEKTIKDLRQEDIEEFIQFCQKPSKSWIGLKKAPRFIEKDDRRWPLLIRRLYHFTLIMKQAFCIWMSYF